MRFITLFLFLLVSGFALAQSVPPPLTAEDAATLAIKNNPRLSGAARDVVAAQSGVRSARALTNPNFVFAPGITSISGSGDELTLSQPLELNGTRSARGGIAGAQLRIAQAEAIVELRNLVFNTKSAYYQLVQARELQSLSRDTLHVAQEFDRLTRRLVELGKRPGIELLQTGIEVARAEQQVTLADSQEVISRAALDTLLGRPADTAIASVSPLTPLSETVDVTPLLQQALSMRAEIAGAQATQDTFRQEARLARAEGRPDRTPQMRVGSLIRGVPDANSGNGFGVGLAITLPIFDYGSRRNRVRQAEEAARAQSDRITGTQNQVRQEVTQAVARLRAAQSVTQNYQQSLLDRARRLLDASRTGFQEGQTGILVILDAQRTYRTVQTDYINALVNLALARAELEHAAGTVPASLLPPRRPK